jgi:cysteine desulfurase
VVSVMLANNETGTIQPVPQIAAAAHAHGAVVHVDAAQAAGKTGIDVTALGADLLTVVGHKMYAPKGIAALYVRAGTALEPVIYGGGQERGLRAGTENVALIAALGAAAELAARELAAGAQARLAGLRERLHSRLAAALPGRIQLNGLPGRRLPTTLNISITGSAATSCSPPPPASPPPPGPPATAASTNPPRCSPRWAWTRTAPWPRSACPSAAGPPRLTSTPLPASSPQPPSG